MTKMRSGFFFSARYHQDNNENKNKQNAQQQDFNVWKSLYDFSHAVQQSIWVSAGSV